MEKDKRVVVHNSNACTCLLISPRSNFPTQALTLGHTHTHTQTHTQTQTYNTTQHAQRGIRAWDLTSAAVWAPHDVYQRAAIRVDGRVVQEGKAGIVSPVIILSNATA
jgi:hypothetical protein